MKLDTKDMERIGYCGVDSGQLMVCDPCYINSEWAKSEFGEKVEDGHFSYAGACKGTIGGEPVQLKYKLGHDGVGVAFPSGYGDGYYPVYAKRDSDGRIVAVVIKMD